MAKLRETRRKLRWFAGVLLALDAIAIGVMLSPLVGTPAARQGEFQEVRRQVQSRLATVVPPDKVQQRVDEARTQIDGFYRERIPASMSAITKHLGDVAAQNGVRLLSAKYETTESELPGLQRVRIDATLSGGYVQEVKFINALERQKPFFIVDGILLGETQGGDVRLGVTLETFVKTGT